MRFHWLIGAAAVALLMQVSPSARAGLTGATVQTASYLDVSNPPPAASPTECTIINCTILDYEGPGGPTNSPLPIVPVTYLQDFLSETTVSVGDTQITITNNLAGLFCPSGGCTPGDFSGYVFTFTGAPDITNVEAGGSSDFQPVDLTWTTDSITVNVAGDNLAVGDQLILDVTAGTQAVPVPEPSNLAKLALLAIGLVCLVAIERRGGRGSGATGACS